MIWYMPPAALLPFLGIVPICRDLLAGVMIRLALLYYSFYRFKNLEDMPNDVIQRFIWIYSSQWSNPRNYYKLNILCHIYYQPCKTAQRSEENCIVTPAFRHLFSTWLFIEFPSTLVGTQIWFIPSVFLFPSAYHGVLYQQEFTAFPVSAKALMSCVSEQHKVYIIKYYSQDIPERLRTLQQPLANGTPPWGRRWLLSLSFVSIQMEMVTCRQATWIQHWTQGIDSLSQFTSRNR